MRLNLRYLTLGFLQKLKSVSKSTAKDHVDILKEHKIRISMDGKDESRKERVNCFTLLGSEPQAICFSIAVGKAIDNICIERFWRSTKYEELYLNHYKSISELRYSIDKYMKKHNIRRLYSALDNKTPNEVYFKSINNLEFQQQASLIAS